MMWIYTLIRSLILAGFVVEIHGRVKVSFRLVSYENSGHYELDGGCCDTWFGCNRCDNEFTLCFDVYGGNNDMNNCAYGKFQTDLLYENDDDFSFPSSLASNLVNPIVLTINSWSTGFKSKTEVWDYDPQNSDDKIDYYGYNHNYSPDRTSALATEHTVTLNGAGSSLTRVAVKVYCDVHYYGTSSGCSTYCLDNSEGHYYCNYITGAKVCHPGWQGSYCSIEINECDSDPCQFNAVCTDLLVDYSCDCPAGTRGKNCDDIDECSSDPCEHGGTCENELNHHECDCPREYSGANCEFEIDFCDSDPCLNGATCLGENDNGVLECVCAPGYNGVFCDADIDECIGVDCLNNGTCQDGVNEFTCNCTEGYVGAYCELDIRDECASRPCQNNASCVDMVGGYVCVCRAGFQSGNCEEDINECDPDPCSYGNCTDQVGRYTCDCLPGYSGENCTVNTEPCSSSPCQNDGSCHVVTAGDGSVYYICQCPEYYAGTNCELPLPMGIASEGVFAYLDSVLIALFFVIIILFGICVIKVRRDRRKKLTTARADATTAASTADPPHPLNIPMNNLGAEGGSVNQIINSSLLTTGGATPGQPVLPNVGNTYASKIYRGKEPPSSISTSIPPPLPHRDYSTRAVPSEYDVPISQGDNSTRKVPSAYNVPRTIL